MTIRLQTSQGECSPCAICEEYNKVFKHKVWCPSLCSKLTLGGEGLMLLTALPLPKLWPMHEQKPKDNHCHPLGEET